MLSHVTVVTLVVVAVVVQHVFVAAHWRYCSRNPSFFLLLSATGSEPPLLLPQMDHTDLRRQSVQWRTVDRLTR